MTQENNSRAVSRLVIALTAYFLFLIVYWIYAQMYYFADGAYFFLHLLETGDFLQLNPNRMHAHYVAQFLPLMAIKILGIRNYPLLSYLFGINLYLPYLVSLAICYSLVKKDNIYLMVFPLLSLFGVSMNGSLLAMHQLHVMESVFWPILFYVTLKERLSLKDSIILFVLLLVFMKSYESALFLGPILAFISIQKIVRKGGPQKVLWAVATAFFFASAIIALREILHPYDVGNRYNFIRSVFELYQHYPAVMSMGFIIFIFLSFLQPELLKRYFIPIGWAFFALMILVSFSPLLAPNVIKPSQQYNARVMSAYVIPPMAIFFYLIVNRHISVSRDTWNRIGILVAILIFGQVSWHLITASQWNGFRKVFKRELSQHSGLVSFENSVLSRNSVGHQLIEPFAWGWTVTTMSILWSDGGNVSSIVTNKPQYAAWGPFDPVRVETLPKIEQFGFSYKTYRESPHEVDRTYTLNTKLIFSIEGNFSRYIQDGWSIAETDHVWTSGKKGSLAFKTVPPDFDPTIEIEVSPFIVPPRVTKQRLTLIVNGEEVGQSEITAPGKIQFKVGRDVWLRNNTAIVEFILPDAVSPTSIGFNDDPRVIALAFRSLTIH